MKRTATKDNVTEPTSQEYATTLLYRNSVSVGTAYKLKAEDGTDAIKLCSNEAFRDATTNVMIRPIREDENDSSKMEFIVEFNSELPLEKVRLLVQDQPGGYFMGSNLNTKTNYTGRPYYNDILVTTKNAPAWEPKCAPSPWDFLAQAKETREKLEDKTKGIPERFPEEKTGKSIYEIVGAPTKPFGQLGCPGHCPYYFLFHTSSDRKDVENARLNGPKPKKCSFHLQKTKCFQCAKRIDCFNDCISACEYCFHSFGSNNYGWAKTRKDYYEACRGENDPIDEPDCEEYSSSLDGDEVICKDCYLKARAASRYRRDCDDCLKNVISTKGKPTAQALKEEREALKKTKRS